MKTVAVLNLFLPLVCSLAAHGAISGLINTGIDKDGSHLALGAAQDGWKIVSVSPPNPPGGLIPTDPPSNTYVVPPYLGWMPTEASPASAWISYSYPLNLDGDGQRTFAYELKFTAEASDTFWMRVAADNSVGVSLNGGISGPLIQWGPFDPPSDLPYLTWSPWVEVSNIVDGENTLTLSVGNLSQDFGNPTGLRVEFSSLPEPSIVMLVNVGVVLLIVGRCSNRRRGSR